MVPRDDLERLFEQGDFEALLTGHCDDLTARGELKEKAYWLERIANQADNYKTDPKKLNLCLYAMRNLGIMLANIGNEETDQPGYELVDPKRAYNLYEKILREYPNERQAMFTKCELGKLCYDETYKKYGVPHDPDKGMVLFQAWEEECAEAQGLETVPMLCFGVGLTISNGRYTISRDDQGYNYEDLVYAKNLLKKVDSDAGQIYEMAQTILEVVEHFLPLSKTAGIWECIYRFGSEIHTWVRFEFSADCKFHYESSQGANVDGAREIKGNRITFNTTNTMEFIIENDNEMTLRTQKPEGGIEETLFMRTSEKLAVSGKVESGVNSLKEFVNDDRALEKAKDEARIESEIRSCEQERDAFYQKNFELEDVKRAIQWDPDAPDYVFRQNMIKKALLDEATKANDVKIAGLNEKIATLREKIKELDPNYKLERAQRAEAEAKEKKEDEGTQRITEAVATKERTARKKLLVTFFAVCVCLSILIYGAFSGWFNKNTEKDSIFMPQFDETQPIDTTSDTMTRARTTYVTTVNLNLRAGPSTSAKSFGVIPKNTTVEVIDFLDYDWFQVICNGKTGYMKAEYLKLVTG